MIISRPSLWLRLVKKKTVLLCYNWFIVSTNGIAPQLKTKVKFWETAGIFPSAVKLAQMYIFDFRFTMCALLYPLLILKYLVITLEMKKWACALKTLSMRMQKFL